METKAGVVFADLKMGLGWGKRIYSSSCGRHERKWFEALIAYFDHSVAAQHLPFEVEQAHLDC